MRFAMQPTSSSAGIRTLLSLAWPIVLARSAQSIIGFCDALMIAPLGEDALAAVTTGAVNTLALVILPMGLVFIVQSFASQLQGKGDLLGARRYAWYGLILSAAIALAGIAVIPLVPVGLGLFSYDPAVHAYMSEYMAIRLLGLGAIIATETLGNWYGGLGNTRLHMAAGILAMVVNVFLNWVLIQGNLGAPALGVEGAAIASVIATWAGFGLLAVVFGRATHGGRKHRSATGRSGDGQSPTDRLGLRWAEMARMLRFGVPNGINWFLEFAAFTFFINVVIGSLGTVALAATMVVLQINSVSFMPAFGMSSAGAILVGQTIGKGQRDDVPAIVRRTMAVAATWQGAVGALYLILPATLMSWFIPPTENAAALLGVGTTILALSAAWQLFDAVALTLGEALRAAGDTAWSMWVRLGLAWVAFAPGAWLAVHVLEGGVVAAVLCIMGYVMVLAAALTYRFYVSRGWREIDMTGSDAALL
jgi:MATE family multidrug resistance protein